MFRKDRNPSGGGQTGYVSYTKREYACGISFSLFWILLVCQLVLVLVDTARPLLSLLMILCLISALLLSNLSWFYKIGGSLLLLLALGFWYGSGMLIFLPGIISVFVENILQFFS